MADELSFAGSMPVWAQWSMVVLLVMLSAMFSGLTLGVLSLDKTVLEILIDSGEPEERKYAKTVYPIRERGNLLLCTLLFGNVSVNALTSILMSEITSGLIGFFVSTITLVIFGEIIPQALCSRHGLKIGYYSRFVLYPFMIMFYTVAFPVSKCLDLVLGEEVGLHYTKTQLTKLVQMHGEGTSDEKPVLNPLETTILKGALEFGQKTVSKVMTPWDQVFALELDTKLDVEALDAIQNSGYSRVPVYEKSLHNVVGLLVVKDLLFVNPADAVPLRAVLNQLRRDVFFVYEDETLDKMLHEFKRGRSHVAVVQRINNSGPGDPVLENIGLVSLEDVIEELIQDEILDETDLPSAADHSRTFSVFRRPGKEGTALTPQLAAAITSYLSSSKQQFSPERISPSILQRVVQAQQLADAPKDAHVYVRGRLSTLFTLLLQGRVDVVSGEEEFRSERGPWDMLGIGALTDHAWRPDFTARVAQQAQLFQLSKTAYDAAVLATVAEREARARGDSAADIERAVDAVLRRAVSALPGAGGTVVVSSPAHHTGSSDASAHAAAGAGTAGAAGAVNAPLGPVEADITPVSVAGQRT